MSLLSWHEFVERRVECGLVSKLPRKSVVNKCKQVVDAFDENSNPKSKAKKCYPQTASSSFLKVVIVVNVMASIDRDNLP